ncbi:MAG: hypothetical protein KC496_16505 [Anaerolineae bacterium]|nr:hypothetical protein [Anaerolineae bacterium]
MKPNLLLDFENALVSLCDMETGETLLHAENHTPILQVCRADAPPAQVGLHGVWQLIQDDVLLCTYIGGKNRDGLMFKQLQRIEGQQITAVRFLRQKQHLFFDFSNGITLRLFSSPLREESYRVLFPQPENHPGTKHPVFLMTCYGVHRAGISRVTWQE